MRFACDEERRYWRLAAALLGAIFLSSYWVRILVEWLRDRNLLRIAIAAAFVLVAVAIGAWIARAGGRWRAAAALVAVGGVYASANLGLEIVQERIHLLQYGALALLAESALRARAGADATFGLRSPAAWAAGAFAVAFAGGFADEALQGLLPQRYYDLRDVGLNGVSAALALVARELVKRAVAGDRAARAMRAAGGAPS